MGSLCLLPFLHEEHVKNLSFLVPLLSEGEGIFLFFFLFLFELPVSLDLLGPKPISMTYLIFLSLCSYWLYLFCLKCDLDSLPKINSNNNYSSKTKGENFPCSCSLSVYSPCFYSISHFFRALPVSLACSLLITHSLKSHNFSSILTDPFLCVTLL